MHVTKKHGLDYHAWYNYPQISSQDYEVLAAIRSYFFCGFWQKIAVIGTFLVLFISFLFFANKKEKKRNQRKEKTREQNAKHNQGSAPNPASDHKLKLKNNDEKKFNVLRLEFYSETLYLVDEFAHQPKDRLHESFSSSSPRRERVFLFFGYFLSLCIDIKEKKVT